MFNKIKAIKDLRDQAKQMQSMMEDITVTGEGMRGGIKIRMNGSQTVLSVDIEAEAMEQKGKLEEGVKDAVNDAIKQVQKAMMEKMKESGGMDMFKNMGL